MATTGPSTTTYAPTQSTLAELQNYVLDYIQANRDDELMGIAKRAINRAIDKINTKNWIKINTKQDFVTTLGLLDYPLSRDFRDPISVVLMNSSQYPVRRLPYKDYKTLETEHQNATGSGTPVVYTIYYSEQLFSLSRAPDQAFVDAFPYMRLRYHKRFMYLDQASDSHGGPPEFNAFIGWYARADVARVRGEPQLAREAVFEHRTLFADLRETDHDTMTDWE